METESPQVAKVAHLREPVRNPNPQLVESLRTLLRRAEAGEIVDAVVLFQADATFASLVSGVGNTQLLTEYIGQLEVMKAELVLDVLSSGDDCGCEHEH